MKIFLMALMLLFATAAYAEDSPADICEKWAELAGKLMEFRQMGGSMAEIIGKSGMADDSIYRQMVIKAYKTPRFGSEGYRREAVQDFANEIYLGCFEVMIRE